MSSSSRHGVRVFFLSSSSFYFFTYCASFRRCISAFLWDEFEIFDADSPSFLLLHFHSLLLQSFRRRVFLRVASLLRRRYFLRGFPSRLAEFSQHSSPSVIYRFPDLRLFHCFAAFFSWTPAAATVSFFERAFLEIIGVASSASPAPEFSFSQRGWSASSPRHRYYSRRRQPSFLRMSSRPRALLILHWDTFRMNTFKMIFLFAAFTPFLFTRFLFRVSISCDIDDWGQIYHSRQPFSAYYWASLRLPNRQHISALRGHRTLSQHMYFFRE